MGFSCSSWEVHLFADYACDTSTSDVLPVECLIKRHGKKEENTSEYHLVPDLVNLGLLCELLCRQILDRRYGQRIIFR